MSRHFHTPCRGFSLYLRRKKGYNCGVPICPTCHASIHPGAETRCPACGYSLARADEIFGNRQVEFTRVLDEAGALTHQDRIELLRALEDMERNIPPIALCIYITADGRAQDFRPHAHWILNHAHIHHPSFGKREQAKAVEDAEFTELEPGTSPQREAPPPTSWWQRFRAYMRDAMHPYPPPVRREWMLILVLDVQLEVACFSWGYMLDPYINPDSINSCILRARLQFRERAMVVALKKVMRAAVNQIAAQSHRANRRMRRAPQVAAALTIGAALGIMAEPLVGQTPAQAAPPASQGSPWAEDEAAEEVDDDPAPPSPAAPATAASATAPAEAAGAAATDTSPPRWATDDYRHLLSGELNGGYKMLLAERPAGTPARTTPTTAPTPSRSAPESDTKVPKHYYPQYGMPDKSGLIDPQHLLSNTQYADVAHTLRMLNAHSPYRLYIAVYKQGQELPMELAVGALVRSVAEPGEYAAMIMYGIGDAPQVELGYHEINLTDDNRMAWLEQTRTAARECGNGVEGIMAAAQVLHSCLAPVAAELPPLTNRTTLHTPLIPIEMRPDEAPKEPSFRDQLREAMADPAMRPVLTWVLGILGGLVLVALLLWLRRRSGHLYKTPPDVRLGSPYGAGLSRNVRYLEGKVAAKGLASL